MTIEQANQLQTIYDNINNVINSGTTYIKDIYIPDATRPAICMEINCSYVDTLSFSINSGVNAGGNYSRGIAIYKDRNYTGGPIFSQSILTGTYEVDLSEYDSVVIVISDYAGGQFLISDFKLYKKM